MLTNEQVLSRMAEDLRLRGLAAGTQHDYLMHARIFLEFAKRPTEDLTEEDIRTYLSYLLSEKKLCPATVNTYNAALRFLFAVTLNRNLNYRQIPRLKQVRSLPEILTRKEVIHVCHLGRYDSVILFDNTTRNRPSIALLSTGLSIYTSIILFGYIVSVSFLSPCNASQIPF